MRRTRTKGAGFGKVRRGEAGMDGVGSACCAVAALRAQQLPLSTTGFARQAQLLRPYASSPTMNGGVINAIHYSPQS